MIRWAASASWASCAARSASSSMSSHARHMVFITSMPALAASVVSSRNGN